MILKTNIGFTEYQVSITYTKLLHWLCLLGIFRQTLDTLVLYALFCVLSNKLEPNAGIIYYLALDLKLFDYQNYVESLLMNHHTDTVWRIRENTLYKFYFIGWQCSKLTFATKEPPCKLADKINGIDFTHFIIASVSG